MPACCAPPMGALSGSSGLASTSSRSRAGSPVAEYHRRVALPLKPPIAPQLALSRKELPEGGDWGYEPKYDGFRPIVFVDGDEAFVQSRNGKPLSRYFPELEFGGGRYVLDGELVILGSDGAEVFD